MPEVSHQHFPQTFPQSRICFPQTFPQTQALPTDRNMPELSHQQKLLHDCITTTRTIQVCRNVRCQKLVFIRLGVWDAWEFRISGFVRVWRFGVRGSCVSRVVGFESRDSSFRFRVSDFEAAAPFAERKADLNTNPFQMFCRPGTDAPGGVNSFGFRVTWPG
jgi:hypothetical protein